MTADWLTEFLRDSIAKHLCTRINCTTCGTHTFRDGLSKGLDRDTELGSSLNFERVDAIAIATALAGVPEPKLSLSAWEEAVRYIFMDLWTGLPFLDQEIERLLAESWAGNVLQRMKEHHHQRQLAADLASPAKARERRAENKRQKQAVHLARLAAKVKRDADWKAAQCKSQPAN